jgi:ADP-ribosylglycohydrolase
MKPVSRRTFLASSLAVTGAVVATGTAHRAQAATPPRAVDLRDRARGLLTGTALGDALGGPIEFQPRLTVQKLDAAPKLWREDEILDAPARLATARRLRLRSYAGIRPKPESYAHWNTDAEPGTITDDTRHKLVLLDALKAAERKEIDLEVRDLAQAYLDWPRNPAIRQNSEYQTLAADWLEEWQLAARWVLGERDLTKALPPERMWQGMPTCSGQMTLLPLAALFPGQPERAYRAAWSLGFFDNGYGKDLNAALVAGLATALVTPVDPESPKAAWDAIFTSMRETDPFGYRKIRWTSRSVDRWLDLALQLAAEADHHPGKFFAVLEKGFNETIKWEAQVPFVVAFGCFALADFDPLAALQLTLEWGHDTDSYAQLAGAFVGALHGTSIFPADWRKAVATRLQLDFDVDLEEASALLDRLRREARTRPVIKS